MIKLVFATALLFAAGSCGTAPNDKKETPSPEQGTGERDSENGSKCEYLDIEGTAEITKLSEKDPPERDSVRHYLKFTPTDPQTIKYIGGICH